MKKMTLKLSVEDGKRKRKALKVVAAVEGVDSVALDLKEKRMIVIGEADPVFVVARLRRFGFNEVDLLSVGPAKEEKKEDAKSPRDAKNKVEVPSVKYVVNPKYRSFEYTGATDENPKPCAIS